MKVKEYYRDKIKFEKHLEKEIETTEIDNNDKLIGEVKLFIEESIEKSELKEVDSLLICLGCVCVVCVIMCGEIIEASIL